MNEQFSKLSKDLTKKLDDKEKKELTADAYVSEMPVDLIKLFIPKQAEILAIAKSCGYILTERMPLDAAGYKNQNIYVLRRPE